MNLEEGDIVLCTVDRIIGTIVFVKLEIPGEKLEGSIVFSEVAPGRIRNIRDYVVPKKKIVCKVLRLSGNRIDLSLRRVTQKEQKELIEKVKQEKSYRGILKSILKEKTDEIIIKINQTETLYDFINEVKENSKKLENLVGKENSDKILEILNSQKQRKAIIKKKFNLTTNKSNGIQIIKQLLENQNGEISYTSAGKYSLKVEADDVKSADKLAKEILTNIEDKSKKLNAKFSI